MQRFFACACAMTLLSGCAATSPNLASKSHPLQNATHLAPNDGTAATQGPIVVLVTIDGFPARALKDPKLPMPTLRKLMAQGSYAESMQPINPTITWPNHTAMITGVNAGEHHVMANGLIALPADGADIQVQPWVPREQLVHGRTLYDALAERGMSTGQVDWVAIYGANHVAWSFAERPRIDSPIAQDLISQGIVTHDDIADFQSGSPAWKDEIWTDAAIDTLTRHTPNLLLFHLLQTDSLQHIYGTLTPAAYTAYAYADSCLARLMAAARVAGLLDRITFVIASDHGFANYTHTIRANAALVQGGLLHNQKGRYTGDVWVLAEGGEASLYIHGDAQRATLLPTLKAAFEKTPGVAAVYTNEQATKLGIPARSDTDQAPDLYLIAKPGYAFMPGTEAPIVQDISPQRGAHGYLNTDPDMQALFVISGAHIRQGVNLGAITNLRVAPTIAKLLGVSLPDAKQPPLAQILQ